ncbi:MAG: enoyl-ACP reductase FabI [Alcanivorax sp.]|jgi:enoyl-[acyl-carrier protein] reductase I|uniref:enoyl-ACP reductase FabI n=1 Tax=Thalassolituus TaxID=187492 RepID=UPI0023F2715F|nr:enoyl-ACP reductase FabI [Thalassolituus oleivorans]|tara:strand:- start:14627 stop:15397 length:771 start_codon:yes stop_codon:yes gene_type:complete
MTIDLKGKKGLVVGIANENSIAWGCAKAFYEAGAELAITYLNGKAEPYVRPLADRANAAIIAPLDVSDETQVTALFDRIHSTWGELDFLVHAIAFAPREDLQGRVTDCSRQGFLKAMDISCYSFIRLAHLAEPLMKRGGSLLTTTYYGGEKVVGHYGLMGPVKAALESTVKYLAAELGEKHIRVNALSPGPIATRATGGIAHFDELLQRAKQKSPEHELVCINCVGSYARFLVSDEARLVTGSTVYIDAGYNIMGA